MAAVTETRHHFREELAHLEEQALGGLDMVVAALDLTLVAREAPVATDLRTVAALLHVIKHVERMGDQCVNIAKLIPLSGHEPPVREDIRSLVLRMGRAARSGIVQARA